MKSIEMDLSAADSNDYIHSDRGLQFKRERRKVGKQFRIDNTQQNVGVTLYFIILCKAVE